MAILPEVCDASAVRVSWTDYDTQSDSCGGAWPEPTLMYAPDPFSGRSVTGNVCFRIAQNDAASLRLFTEIEFRKKIWFSLR